MIFRFIDKTAQCNEIAPFGTKCVDFDWRLSLKVGDEVDACDSHHVWYSSTVVGIRETQLYEGRVFTEVKIGKKCEYD
jgi:hypothetical protein